MTFPVRAASAAPGALILLAAVLAIPAALHFAPHDVAHALWLRPLLAVLTLFVALVAEGALYRVGVSDSAAGARALGLGPAGLQFGEVEVRLFLAGLTVTLFLTLIAMAAGMAATLTAGILGVDLLDCWGGLSRGDWRSWASVLAVAAAVWAVFQLAVRLCLYKAATVARGRMVSLNAMGLSEHNFWRLLAGLILVCLPAVALAAWGHGGRAPGPWFPWIAALVMAFLQVPLAIGFFSDAYRRLEYWRPQAIDGSHG